METQRALIHQSPKRKRDEYELDSSSVTAFPPELSQGRCLTSTSSAEKDNFHATEASQSKDGAVAPQKPAALRDSFVGKHALLEIRDRTHNSQSDSDQEAPRDLDFTSPSRRHQKRTPPKDQHFGIESSSPSSPSSTKAQPKSKDSLPLEPKKRCKSPPLTAEAEEDDLTWHDWEITGHDPTDPDDDGYGINGIGFKPTAAIAWSRSQQRKKQLEEWRRHESRDARNKRREKRRGVNAADSSPNTSPSNKKKVTFVT